MTAGFKIEDAPRDGTEIVAETMNYCGVPATGHYGFRRIKWATGAFPGWVDAEHQNSHLGDSGLLRWWPAGTPESDLEKTERTNWNFVPSNGTSGDAFYGDWCERCIRERPIRDDYDRAIANGLGCDIYMRSMAFGIGDAQYPTEWTYDRGTGQPKCTAFELDVGEPKQEPRCENTIDMFPPPPSNQ